MLKSIAIVLGCYLLAVALVIVTDPLISLMFPGDFVRGGRIPSNNGLLVSTAFFVVIAFFCAWLCARLSANAGRNVLWFFVLGEVVGIAATIPGWRHGWPHWYGISWLVAWPICCWIGLLASGRRTNRSTGAPAGPQAGTLD